MKININRWHSWLRTRGCCVGMVPGPQGIDLHHIIGHGRNSQRKRHDLFVIPLTHELHMQLHEMGYRAWEEEYGDQRTFWFRLFEAAMAEGAMQI